MRTVKKITKKTIAILMIMSIFMPHFSILSNTISYAIDNGKTNNENIEISAYFEDENGEKLIEKEIEIGNSLKLKIDVTVKNEKGYGGYFDGKIELSNVNFKFKDENDNIDIHINAGETKTIEKDIEFKYVEDIGNDYLNKKSEISIKGKYVNSKKTYDIEGNTNVIVKWKSNSDVKSEMNMSVLTYEDKLLQLLIESKVNNNSYPIKDTKIDITLPDELENDKIESIKVHKRTTDGTNGNKKFDETNYEIKDKNISIIISNVENPLWKKNASDILIVTIELKEDTSIENLKIEGKNTLSLYDGKEITENANIEVKNKVDGKVTADIIENEKQIYKGKIYTGEDRLYTSITNINIDYVKDIEEININENRAVYVADEEKDANILYKDASINKEQFINIFGEEGYLTIEDQDKNIIANINKDSESDEKGNIKIEFAEDIYNINIITSKPIATGILKIVHTKNIREDKLKENEIREIKSIKEEIKVNEYIANCEIELKETKTEASMEIDHLSFKNSEENKDVKIEINFITNGEDKDLYKNPTFEITFPKQVVAINAKYRMLYGNGLEITNGSIYEKNGKKVLRFELKGNQEKYPSQAVEETKIIIYSNVVISEKAENSEEEIKLNYTNEKGIQLENKGIKTVKVQIIADKPVEDNTDIPVEEKVENREAKIEATYRAEVGENILENNSEVKSGEVIRYRITAKNIGSDELKGVTLKGQIPEGTTHVEVNEKVVVYGFVQDDDETIVDYGENGNQFFADDFDYYNKTDKKEITINTDLKPNQTKVLEYEVKVNENVENDKIITNNILIIHDNKEIVKNSISSKLKNSEIEVTTLPILRESVTKKLEAGYAYEYNVRVKNNSNRTKNNITVEINTNNLLKILSIGLVNGDNEYLESYDTNLVKIKELKPNETAKIIVQARANEPGEKELLATISSVAKENNGISYRSNKIYESVESVGLSISLTSSNNNEYLKPGDKTTYYIDVKNDGELEANSLWISDYISEKMIIENVKVNNSKLEEENYDIYDYEGFQVMNFGKPLKPGESIKIEIEAKLSDRLKTSKDLLIENYAKLSQAGLEKESEKIVYKVSANTIPGESEDEYDSDSDSYQERYNQDGDSYTIKGIAWFDENRNGKRDINEKLLSGIEVSLINLSTSKFAKDSFGVEIKDVTGENGEYTLNDIPQGEYVVIFRYDTNTYTTTTYIADIATSNTNSDAIERVLKMNEEREKVGATDIISVYGNLSNVDIGLVEAGILSFELEKTVNKIIVRNNSGTKTYEFDNQDLAKVEIKAKEVKGSTVLIEYVIKVKNTGTIGGYARSVVDYYPKNLKYSEELNSNGWYIKGNELYNDSLANELIGPGEELEIPIILSMVMTETNTGLINNIAEIEEAYDINGNSTTEKIKAETQSDEIMKGSADIIIGVRTGEAVNYIITILTSIILLGLTTYILYKVIHKKTIFKR